MTREELKNMIERYTDEQYGTDESYEAMREITWEMYNSLNLSGKVYTMTVEDGSILDGDAMDMAELIHCNYSEIEWITFMWQAEKEHGKYELNPYGNTVITIEW